MNRKSQSTSSKLPFVFINVATTVDGKLAPANRHFVPFSSKRDQRLLLELRARADAVMAARAQLICCRSILVQGDRDIGDSD
jgi:hypothetical protein